MANVTRNVTSSTLSGREYVCVLTCGHTVICAGVRVRGARFSQRAPLTAICIRCSEECRHV